MFQRRSIQNHLPKQMIYQPYYQQPSHLNTYHPKQSRGIIRNRPGRYQYAPEQQFPYYHSPYPHYAPPPQAANSSSLFRDSNGKLDFKKIGGGVQNVMGIVNQVSPLMGLFIK